MNENKLVPKLRFPKFSGNYSHEILGNFSEKSNLKNKDNNLDIVFSNSAINGLILQKDFFDKDIANKKNIYGYYIVDKDNFVYNPRISNNAPVGPINMNKTGQKGLVSPLYMVFKIDKSKVNEYYLDYYYSSDLWHTYMRSIANYGARFDRMNITIKDFFKMPINLPTLDEQSKIASFLSKIDEKIDLLNEKLDQMKQFKKGLMQQIFSQKLRFDGFTDEWEKVKLGKCISISSLKNKDKEKIVILSVTNKYGFISQEEQFEDREVASSDTSNYKIVEKGDFAYNPARINVGSIARLKTFEKGIISPMYIVFKTKNIINSSFLEHYIDTGYFKLEILKRLEGSVRLTLSADALKNINIYLPSINEQLKIGFYFETIEEKIKLLNKQLDQIEEFKKGLLQSMFV